MRVNVYLAGPADLPQITVLY